MDGNEFRRWVESGFEDYTADPYLYLRELAQNSRDAGAGAIWVEAEHTTDGKEILTFADNGRGMSFEHASQYLFRLYSSSKEQDQHAAGMFGIGFWSILRTNPDKIKIESHTGKTSWAVELDRQLNIKKIPAELNSRGTRIILDRQARFADRQRLQEEVRTALLRFCRYLRRRDRKGTPLPVFFRGESISRPIGVPGPVSLTFKTGAVEGAVGLARQPAVLLYVRGLPVWQGTSLQELSHSTSTKEDNCEIARGLAPVFILNGNNLDVNISRKRVIDNRALKRVKKNAEAALAKLVNFHADSASPLGFFHRFFLLIDLLKRAWNRLSHSLWKQLLLLLIIILPLEIVILNTFFAVEEKPLKNPAIFYVDQNRYMGAAVKSVSTGSALAMSYDPPVKTWFRLFTAEHYHPARGFIRAQEQDRFVSPSSTRRCADSRISVKVHLDRGGDSFLPQPVGCRIDPGSITFNNSPFNRLRINSEGETVIRVPEGGGILRFHCCPGRQDNRGSALSPGKIAALTNLPQELKMPASLDSALAGYAGLDARGKAQKAVELTRSIMQYDSSRLTVEKYKDLQRFADWFSRVRRIGKGDCDVLNGITVLFLRRMGIPARLVIGLTGEAGQVLPGLHAWTEYYHRGWQIVDSSSVTRTAAGPLTNPGQPVGSTAPRPSLPSAKPANLLLYFLITITLLLAPVLFLIYNKKRKEEYLAGFVQRGDSGEAGKTLAQMAVGALLRPGVWGRDNDIRYYRILGTLSPTDEPLRGGAAPPAKNISIDKAMKLAKARKLLKSHRHNPLIEQFTGRGTAILDKDDLAFRPVINLLHGVIDLDRILSLEAIPPEKASHDKTARLLAGVNRLLRDIRPGFPLCRWAPGLKNRDYLDVDLPGSVRYIAVNPADKQVRMLAWLYARNPQLAVFSLIKKLLQNSRMFPAITERIIKKAAVLLIKEMP